MADLSYRVNLANSGHYRFTMPEGFDDKVEVHLWGAGGGYGAGGAAGGAGGYVKSIITILPGATVDIGVGGAGVSAADINTAGAGGTSMTSKYRGGSGGGRGSWCGNVNGPMASAGGGGATAIEINGSAAAVAGGGGGGGGYGHKGAKFGGYAAGVYTDWVMANTNGGNATWGGGGGGGYLGGASGYASGHAVIGGNGGTNFGTVAVNGLDESSILASARLVYNVPTTVGGAGFNGYAILIFTRKKTLLWKKSNGNVRVTLSNVATIATGSTIQQEYTENIQGTAIVKEGTSGGNTIIVSYSDSNVFVNDSGNIASSPWTGNIIVYGDPDDIDSNVHPIATTDLGDWVSVANVYYKTTTSGVLNNLSSGDPTTVSFDRAGAYTFTVPSNVRLITVRASGGGGGAGGYDSTAGASGNSGSLITSRINVTPGATYTVIVGQGGRGGAGGTGNAPGGAGGAGGLLGASGGSGSNAGPNPWSGAGGGGGGASSILSGSTPLIVAAGGGGGGGGGNNSGGQGVNPGGTSASPAGGAGTAKGGDGGGAGGGGGGYPLGGAGGAVQAGDNGGYSGGTGMSYPTEGPGYSLIVNGGSVGGAPNGNPGADGLVEISYNVYYYLPGTWVPVESIYYKLDGEWQNLVSTDIPAITKIG